jgi:hypothetical protein
MLELLTGQNIEGTEYFRKDRIDYRKDFVHGHYEGGEKIIGVTGEETVFVRPYLRAVKTIFVKDC